MPNNLTPLTYGLDEARQRLRDPPPSRSSMYGMIKAGTLKVAGYIGDRPFFTDQDLIDCRELLRQRHTQNAPPMRRTRP